MGALATKKPICCVASLTLPSRSFLEDWRTLSLSVSSDCQYRDDFKETGVHQHTPRRSIFYYCFFLTLKMIGFLDYKNI